MKKSYFILFVILALAVTPAFALAQKGRNRAEAGSGSGAGLSSGMIGIVQGQSVRLSVWNGGDKDVSVRLLLIDGDGKILILCTNLVASGQSFSDKFTHPGGNDRIEIRGEIQADDQGGSDMLTPSLQVIDDQTSKTVVAFGPCDFRRIKLGD